ncbi:hypothetical protein BKA69DRAFT_1173596 [Paraphysoderma sedebokerense]|nr:hypothetical protein BKA69DRAFT_1173596 [Paraphysoderma sedebokerense]
MGSSSKTAPRTNPLLVILLVASLVLNAFGQSRWQDVTTFHPYCRQLFRGCVNSSSTGGVGSDDYNVAVGICGNKMALCTFWGNLTWPWSSHFGRARPASAPTSASSSQLTMYRNILASPATVPATPWQNVTDFLPDCREGFLRCVDTHGGPWQDNVTGVCGHGMSVCTERQGRWPFGNDSSAYWQQPYTNERLTLYRNVSSGIHTSARNWQSLTVFLPVCRHLMAQCIAVSNGSSSDNVVGNCGNRMAICTFENILWPLSYDAFATSTESFDARWQRYATNLIDSIPRWQDITRFSFNCTDRFFECVYTSTNASDETSVIGVCGNQMSICTFNNNTWPNASQVPTTPDSYSTRLGIYRAILENMLPSATAYFTFPPLYWELYSFSTHTFTNAGITGVAGPSLSVCRTAYASQPWAQNSRFFHVPTRGIQLWTVPATASYTITCAGAEGGSWDMISGGKGAQMRGDFELVRGQIIGILVGQQGERRFPACSTGGGGGSFVWDTQSTTEPLIVAGGGGGRLGNGTVFPGETSKAGTGNATLRIAGSNGMGATPGGAGWKSGGGKGWNRNNGNCHRPLDGGLGGTSAGASLYYAGDGGFGGGASGGAVSWIDFRPCTPGEGGGAGGGGGYSGGAGPAINGNPDSLPPIVLLGGGGGGSYNNGTNQLNLAGVNPGHGFVTITRLYS